MPFLSQIALTGCALRCARPCTLLRLLLTTVLSQLCVGALGLGLLQQRMFFEAFEAFVYKVQCALLLLRHLSTGHALG